MDGENVYRIVIEKQGGNGNATNKETQADNQDQLKAVTKSIANVWSKTALLRTGINATMEIVSRNAGNSQIQARYNAINTLVSQGVTIGLAFAMGGIKAGVTTTAAIGLSYFQEIENNNYEKRWESIGLQEQYRRAGASFNRSRLG